MRGNRRKNSQEAYYTIPSVALDLAQHVVSRFGTNHCYFEPCGGEGSFVEALINLGVAPERIVSVDIAPRHPLVRQGDFLGNRLDLPQNAIAISNPPYGRACSLAVQFFNRCADLGTQHIAFLVPSSFNKVAISDRLSAHFSLVEEWEAPKISYYTLAGGVNERGRLSTKFQLWSRSPKPRLPRRHLRHPWLEFVPWRRVQQGDGYDFCIRTHGSSCGEILDNQHAASLRREGADGRTHLNFRTVAFVRSHHPELRNYLERLPYAEFSASVSYIPCISPAEISILLEKATGVACRVTG